MRFWTYNGGESRAPPPPPPTFDPELTHRSILVPLTSYSGCFILACLISMVIDTHIHTRALMCRSTWTGPITTSERQATRQLSLISRRSLMGSSCLKSFRLLVRKGEMEREGEREKYRHNNFSFLQFMVKFLAL